MAKTLHITIILFLMASSLLANIDSARLLDEIQPQSQLVPTGQLPTVAPTEAEEEPAPSTTLPAGPAGGGHEP